MLQAGRVPMTGMLVLLLIISSVAATTHPAISTVDDSCVTPKPLLPSSLVFRPLVAAIFEPRLGFQFQPSLQRVRLDIGYSADIWQTSIGQQQFAERSAILAVGVDGFTYSRLRSEANLKFPVDAIDYMFGINTTTQWRTDADRIVSARLRLSHISAHLADGYADQAGQLLQQPFVYSREFLDLVVAHEWLSPNVRLYGGGTLLFTVKELPRSVGRIIPQLGVEWLGTIGIPVFAGYDLRVVRIENATQPVHAFQLGTVVLGHGRSSLAVCGYYFAGYSIHGMFFDQRDEYWALGLQVLL